MFIESEIGTCQLASQTQSDEGREGKFIETDFIRSRTGVFHSLNVHHLFRSLDAFFNPPLLNLLRKRWLLASDWIFTTKRSTSGSRVGSVLKLVEPDGRLPTPLLYPR